MFKKTVFFCGIFFAVCVPGWAINIVEVGVPPVQEGVAVPAKDGTPGKPVAYKAEGEFAREAVDAMGLFKYVAAAEDSLALCTNAQCKTDAQFLLNARYFGEDRCDECTRPEMVSACKLFRSRQCSSGKTDIEQKTCQALVNDNMQPLLEECRVSGAIDGVSCSDLALMTSIIAGYRAHNARACEQYMKAYETFMPGTDMDVMFGCRILFAVDPQAYYDKVKEDLVFAQLAVMKNSKQFCGEIHDLRLKQNCLTSLGAK